MRACSIAIRSLLSLILSGWAINCGSVKPSKFESSPEVPALRKSAVQVPPPATRGAPLCRIWGHVFWRGPRPGAVTEEDGFLRVNPNGTLQNVVVFVVNAPAHFPAQSPSPPPEIAVQGGRLMPRVVAVEAGKPLRVVSREKWFHTPVFFPLDSRSFGFELRPFAEHDVVFDKPQSWFVWVKCQAHSGPPWLEQGNIAVLPNGFFDVTRLQGYYQLPPLPAGTYTLAAWHEALGWKQKTVTLGALLQGDVDFEFHSGFPHRDHSAAE